MSRTEIFCFVEGVDNDRYVYSQLTGAIFKKNGVGVEFHAANNLMLSGKQGGKDVLVKFYEHLNFLGLLSADLQGKRTTFVFLLDKDVDDFQGKVKRSKHVFYTEHYDLQNYLVVHGDVVNAAAAGASMPVESISQTLGNQAVWISGCETAWKDWVTICLFLKKNGISLGGYGESSKVNFKEYGPVDQALLATYKELAFRKSGLDQTTFDVRFSVRIQSVDATSWLNRSAGVS